MSIINSWQSLGQYIWPRARHARTQDRQLSVRIRPLAAATRRLTTEELTAGAQRLRDEVVTGDATGDMISIRAAALLQEAARRTLGIELYDEQLLAGLTLARGAIAEMQTGEGKTFAAPLAAFLRVLAGQKVHVATPNSYLAQRDYELLRSLFESLGLSVRLLPEGATTVEKQLAYSADITYGTGYEFGFDYLREQLALLAQRSRALGQRHRDLLRGAPIEELPNLDRSRVFAIVDEVDSVFIDEACVPLIITGEAPVERDEPAVYQTARELAESLIESQHFILDQRLGTASLTDAGSARVHARAGSGLAQLRRPWSEYVEHALYAHRLMQKDVHYIVEDGKISLVDEYTGRILVDRSWREGLHQAVEAKERLQLTPEHSSAAQITRQRYFKLYGTISGMTGTASASAREFWDVYRLPVVTIPLRRRSRRELLPTRYFPNAENKWQAIVADAVRIHATGRPLLIASRTIENSELMARRLDAVGVTFRLLNGKQDADEASIIAASGALGAVTIATNMAGRGTDIKLAPGAEELGGLHLISVERHESARIDGQLMGRVGRQGDRGSCQFFVSAADPLIDRYAPLLRSRLSSLPELGEINRDLDSAIEALQRRIESQHYSQRRRLLAYDRWLDDLRGRLAR